MKYRYLKTVLMYGNQAILSFSDYYTVNKKLIIVNKERESMGLKFPRMGLKIKIAPLFNQVTKYRSSSCIFALSDLAN